VVLGAIALGPMTGPLAFRFVRCVERRRWAMAAVYVAVIAGASAALWLGGPWLVSHELVYIASGGRVW
jgi:hypothetical protein